MSMPAIALPFVSVADPAVGDEGALDPLGFATIADRLADWVLPGMTSRMARPRFLTAIAVSAAVCEGCPSGDGVSAASSVFEWLVVEGFARKAERENVRQTPGIEKVSTAVKAGLRMSAKVYLKTPSVFGFHGVYKRLAQDVGLVDNELRLNYENGYQLLRVWEREQGLEGFADGRGSVFRGWRDAVREAYEAGHSTRSPTWSGWEQLARHLAPLRTCEREDQFLWQLLVDPTLDPKVDKRGEILNLVAKPRCRAAITDSASDYDSVACLMPLSSLELAQRWRVIQAFESFASPLDDAFHRLQLLSTNSGSQPVSASDFANQEETRFFAEQLPSRLSAAVTMMADAPSPLPDIFARIASTFENVVTARDLFEAILKRHADVQKAKPPPPGKREWFERAADDRVMVRPPYRRTDLPPVIPIWRRPYRLRTAVRSFCDDLRPES